MARCDGRERHHEQHWPERQSNPRHAHRPDDLTLRVSKKPKPRTYGGALDAPIEGEGLGDLIGRVQATNSLLPDSVPAK